MNKCAKFYKYSPSDKKVKFNLPSAIGGVLCTTLYRNLMQASNFSGTFNQLFLWIFLWNFHRRCLSTSSIPWCKKVKNDQKLKSRGGGSCLNVVMIYSPTKGEHENCSSTFIEKFFSSLKVVRPREGRHRDRDVAKNDRSSQTLDLEKKWHNESALTCREKWSKSANFFPLKTLFWTQMWTKISSRLSNTVSAKL